jgi:hypothetical protein
MKTKTYFIRWGSEFCVPPWWMAASYRDCSRRQILFAIYGLHWLINFIWWLNFKWCRHVNKPSWIDRQLQKESQKKEGLPRWPKNMGQNVQGFQTK